jgi:peptidoglycan hydrolase-like protein with peptidoglycan-binding domain
VRKVVAAQVVLPSLAPARAAERLASSDGWPSSTTRSRAVDGYYGTDTYEAVLAFQKVNGLPRTGRSSRGSGAGSHGGVPRAYRGGDYIEVDKTRQVLMVVARDRDEGRPRLDRRDRATRRSAAGTSTARSAAGTGCSGTRCTSRAASRSTATRPSRFPGVARLRAGADVDRASLFGTNDYGTTVVVHL